MNKEFIRDRAKFSAIVARRYGVTEDMYMQVTELLAPLASAVSLRKGEFLQRIGNVAQSVYWMQSGVARVGFFTEAGTEVTLRFLMDGEPAGSHEDLLRAREALPAMHFVVAETAMHGYRLDWMEINAMSQRNDVLRDYYLKVSERAILNQGRRIYISAAPAQGRLAAFREEYPGLEQRISQKVIASFLGITPQYMSQLLRNDK